MRHLDMGFDSAGEASVGALWDGVGPAAPYCDAGVSEYVTCCFWVDWGYMMQGFCNM